MAGFRPAGGQGASGNRPALVLSQRDYNRKVGLAIVCPITSKIKGYPFEVLITMDGVQGAVLADQVKSIDWRRRRAMPKHRVESTLVDEVIARFTPIIAG